MLGKIEATGHRRSHRNYLLLSILNIPSGFDSSYIVTKYALRLLFKNAGFGERLRKKQVADVGSLGSDALAQRLVQCMSHEQLLRFAH
jgi:hypothetical protein